MVSDVQLQETLMSGLGAEATCRKLVDSANANGGQDNIMLIVARFLSSEAGEPRAFVEAEVLLEALTRLVSDADKDDKDTVILGIDPT